MRSIFKQICLYIFLRQEIDLFTHTFTNIGANVPEKVVGLNGFESTIAGWMNKYRYFHLFIPFTPAFPYNIDSQFIFLKIRIAENVV